MPDRRPVVLVVDDEESFVDALQVGLSREGFEVRVARDGAEALDEFAASAPDVISMSSLVIAA